MTKEDLNQMIVEMYEFYIHLQDDNEEKVFDFVCGLSSDERVIKRLSSAFGFISRLYPLLNSGLVDKTKLSRNDLHFFDLFEVAENNILEEDEKSLLSDLSSIELDDDPSLIN